MAVPFGFGSWVDEGNEPVAAAAARQAAAQSKSLGYRRHRSERWGGLPGSGNIEDRRTNKTVREALNEMLWNEPLMDWDKHLEPLRQGETWDQMREREQAKTFIKPEPVNPLGGAAGLPDLDSIIKATMFAQARDRMGRGLQFNADTADNPERSTDQFMWGGEFGVPLDPAEYYERVGLPMFGSLAPGGR